MTPVKTTELPLAAKLYRDGAKFANPPWQLVQGRNRPLIEFSFADVDPQAIDDYRTGADGIVQYENTRRMLLSIIDDQTRKDRAHVNAPGRP